MPDDLADDDTPEDRVENDETLKEYAELLLAQAKLVAGLPLDDPAAFAEAVCRLM